MAEIGSPLTFSAAASLHSYIYLFGGSSPATEDEGFTRKAQRCVRPSSAPCACWTVKSELLFMAELLFMSTDLMLKKANGGQSTRCQGPGEIWPSQSWEVLSSALEVARQPCSMIWQKGVASGSVYQP